MQAYSPNDRTVKKKRSLFVTWRIPGLQFKKSDVEWQPESFCRRGEGNDAHKGACLCWHRWRRYTVLADPKSCSSAAKRTLALTLYYSIMTWNVWNHCHPGILGCVCFATSPFLMNCSLLWRQCQSQKCRQELTAFRPFNIHLSRWILLFQLFFSTLWSQMKGWDVSDFWLLQIERGLLY